MSGRGVIRNINQTIGHSLRALLLFFKLCYHFTFFLICIRVECLPPKIIEVLIRKPQAALFYSRKGVDCVVVKTKMSLKIFSSFLKEKYYLLLLILKKV